MAPVDDDDRALGTQRRDRRQVRAVTDMLAANLDSGARTWRILVISIDGENVVDQGGFADTKCTRPWESDTIVNVWSTNRKTVTTCRADARRP